MQSIQPYKTTPVKGVVLYARSLTNPGHFDWGFVFLADSQSLVPVFLQLDYQCTMAFYAALGGLKRL